MRASMTTCSVVTADSYWSLGRNDVSPLLNFKARAPLSVAPCTVPAPASQKGEPILLSSHLFQ